MNIRLVYLHSETISDSVFNEQQSAVINSNTKSHLEYQAWQTGSRLGSVGSPIRMTATHARPTHCQQHLLNNRRLPAGSLRFAHDSHSTIVHDGPDRRLPIPSNCSDPVPVSIRNRNHRAARAESGKLGLARCSATVTRDGAILSQNHESSALADCEIRNDVG